MSLKSWATGLVLVLVVAVGLGGWLSSINQKKHTDGITEELLEIRSLLKSQLEYQAKLLKKIAAITSKVLGVENELVGLQQALAKLSETKSNGLAISEGEEEDSGWPIATRKIALDRGSGNLEVFGLDGKPLKLSPEQVPLFEDLVSTYELLYFLKYEYIDQQKRIGNQKELTVEELKEAIVKGKMNPYTEKKDEDSFLTIIPDERHIEELQEQRTIIDNLKTALGATKIRFISHRN